jgi:hypothetical protein
LRSEDDERAEPDVRVQGEVDNHHHENRKQQIGGERRKKLRQGLDLLGQTRSQSDADADRDPD